MLDLNKMLKNVINDAVNAGIPISENIKEEVLIDYNIETRVGACYREWNTYEIHLSYETTKGKESGIQNVLAHEVIHTCFACMPHNLLWEYYSKIMNEKYGYNIKIKYKWSDIL